jgi:Zn-dependent metalloprotease
VSNFLGAKSFGLFLISCALFSGLIATPTANAISGPNSTPTAGLFDSQVEASPEPLGRVERDAVRAARAQLIKNAAKWGIVATQFQPKTAIAGVAGMSVVRFLQSVNGIEVANSLLAITVDKDGSLLSYTKSISDYSGSLQAAISQTEAKEQLKVKLAQEFGISSDQVMVSQIQLVIVDGALVNEVPNGKYLAWRATTSNMNDATTISMTYLSQAGKQVLSTLPLVRRITAEPFVCDLQTDAIPFPTGVTIDSSQNRYLDVSLKRQALPLCGVNTSGKITNLDNLAAVNIRRTWNYFSSVLGQDINEEKYLGNISQSINNDLTPRISAFINVCATNGVIHWCPYANAFWVPWVSDDCASGLCSGIFFGKNFDQSDDVVAHELSHGVTSALAFYSSLTDTSETAALSEAISDIFGEAMDQLDVQPGELADPAWTMGEDFQVGGFRNLKNPSVMRIDKNWTSKDSHENSGPVNRLAFLLANGGSVGKVKIAPLGSTANSVTQNDLCDVPSECSGIKSMSQLVFETTKNLTATASYFEFGRAMNNACFTLLKAKATGFTTTSCKTVQSALIAQGFTSASIQLAKLPASAKRAKPFGLSVTMRAINGTNVVGQKLSLQVLEGKSWVTKQTRNTNASGEATFSIKLNSKREYKFQVVTYSYAGMYSIKSNSARTKVS